MQHYWIKQSIEHKECGTVGNIIDIYFSATGHIKVSLYCIACGTVFTFDSSFEDVIVSCNDMDRAKQEQVGFDLADWEPSGEGN